jgi:hypothetical protein
MSTQPVFSNKGAVQPLEIRKGADFVFTLALFVGDVKEPLNLNNVQEVRAALVKVGTTTIIPMPATLLMDAPEQGVVELDLALSVTNTLELSDPSSFKPANYHWTADVKLTNGQVLPICTGPVRVIKGDTQWP